MSTVLPQYPFDPTGTAATNKVVETQQIQSRGMFDHYYIIPRSGPFYAESVKLRLYPAGANTNNPALGQALEEGVHYNFGYHFAHASHTIGLPVYGAITFYDRNLAGQLRMEYQNIGGEWVLDDQKYSELLLNVAFNPRIGTWEQVVELPHQFPVVNHDFNIDDFVGMSEVVDELGDIEQAILMKNAGGLADHLADKSNPHDVTKAQVGLGLVDNFPTATVGEATTGTANNRFMTPLRVKQLIDATAQANLNLHMADMNNPHQVTKTQVGLGNVQNYAIATQAEAEAGASAARYMTPVRVREAIVAIIGNAFDAHVADKNNPHQTTKAQVGLGNVPNIPVASDSAALSGVDDSGIITPRLLALVLSQTVGSGVSDHVNNFNNPHGTTKAQVGLGLVQNYGIATEAESRAATANDRYMTPLQVRYAINELVGDSSNAHVTDYTNPHRVTAAQVGTYTEQEIDTLLEDKIGLNDTAANSNRVYGMSQAEMIAWLATQTAGNALKFEGKTYLEAKTDILTGKAADTSKFDGKTYAQVKADMATAVEGSSIQWDVPPMPQLFDDVGNEVQAPTNWVKLGHFSNTAEDLTADLTLLISGGRDDDSLGDFKHHTVLVEIGAVYDNIDGAGPFLMVLKGASVKHLSPADKPIEIGVLAVGTGTDAIMEVWLKSTGSRNRLTITELSFKRFVGAEYPVWEDVADLIRVEPAGIVYPEVIADGSADIEALQTFIARRDNPMQVTKAQVGLGSVNNYGTATDAQAVTGTATNLYMTPKSTAAKVDNDIGLLCDGLISVIDNAMTNLFA
ncbi:hypothetical protein PA10_00069 [Pseudomonas phage pPa_SNUABM_DT01]|nr:hypothetical protein PA10_00069 [Pseudomonas phage pPa_SNUABM_DT01]